MSRISQAFANAKSEQRAALVTFTMACDPDKETSLEVLRHLPAAGSDLIELGMPFSDPMADGPVIQKAANRALDGGAKLADVLEIVSLFRESNQKTPLVLMGYYNPIHHYGMNAFAKAAKAAGVDGLLIVDVPSEEESCLYPALKAEGIDFIRLIAPTTDETRLEKVLAHASGFVYYVAVAGITGTVSGDVGQTAEAIKRIQRHTDLPVATGFGIKNPEDIARFSQHADGVVVGSAIVNQLAECSGDPNCPNRISRYVQTLAKATLKDSPSS